MTDVFYSLTDQSRYVYHYTKASTLANHILHSGKLLLSQFSRVNDPRENKPWTLTYRYSEAVDLDTQALAARLNNNLKHHCRLCCFMADPYEALATRKRELAGEDVVAGPRYERGHSQSPMWAHYGENYTGACLIFDRAKLNDELTKLANENFSSVTAASRRPKSASRFWCSADVRVDACDSARALGLVDALIVQWAPSSSSRRSNPQRAAPQSPAPTTERSRAPHPVQTPMCD